MTSFLSTSTLFTTSCKCYVQYTILCAKGWIDCGVMFGIGVKQDAPFTPTIPPYIKLETYLDEIDGDYPCSINMLNAILFVYVDNVVLLCKLGAGSQRLLNKLHVS